MYRMTATAKWIAGIAVVIVCGSAAFYIEMPTSGALTEAPKPKVVKSQVKPVDHSEQWLRPDLSKPVAQRADWLDGYATVRAQVFSAPNVASAPVGVMESRVRVGYLDVKKDAQGKPEWIRVDKNFGKSKESWIEAKYMTPRADDLIANRYYGVDYGPLKKTEGYPGNPKVAAKGIYLSVNTVGSQGLDNMIRIADTTEINAFVIDVKDDYGRMLFPTKAAAQYCPDANSQAPIKDIAALVKKLKEHHIYLIARIVTFKSPNYAVRYPEKAILNTTTGGIYQSKDGLCWASAYDRQLWKYNVAVAKEAAAAGFNEVQFDYVRFPDIKPSVDATLNYRNTYNESKVLAIYRFLNYARTQLEPCGVYLAADTFGWTASSLTDEGIGQHWESLSNVLDYNCPMIYPSHYGAGNFGIAVPDASPYRTIQAGMNDAEKRDGNLQTPGALRPWIQDFTAKWVPGHIFYGPNQVRAEIQALEDAGVHEFLLWNASNRYTEDALRPAAPGQ